MERTVFLETERLAFSTWTREDYALAASLWEDPEVGKWISSKGYLSEDEVEARLEQEVKREQELGIQYWPIFEKESGQFVGCCGLRPYKDRERVFELGFHLTRDQWGKGYATEAARAVIDYAFTQKGAEALFAGHHPANDGSGKVLRKLGFTYQGEEFYEPTGKMHPSYILLNSDKQSERVGDRGRVGYS
ncbi:MULTISPECIES: GNAT family N-acetyltransferase [unclassified Paenibacillus]|uniref:GNAT family N-acetyltransferase n=1 Tax=unclassified Paenibacillus TaxID=185978 RepID=UPI001F344697|nr:GNAT family N-acetyltransferase [Paenibacillus sp. JJ-223]CAH1203679.1 hypothetical protein PAECIP111890_02304 [Paenibacillus sp. JJ-223]